MASARPARRSAAEREVDHLGGYFLRGVVIPFVGAHGVAARVVALDRDGIGEAAPIPDDAEIDAAADDLHSESTLNDAEAKIRSAARDLVVPDLLRVTALED